MGGASLEYREPQRLFHPVRCSIRCQRKPNAEGNHSIDASLLSRIDAVMNSVPNDSSWTQALLNVCTSEKRPSLVAQETGNKEGANKEGEEGEIE